MMMSGFYTLYFGYDSPILMKYPAKFQSGMLYSIEESIFLAFPTSKADLEQGQANHIIIRLKRNFIQNKQISYSLDPSCSDDSSCYLELPFWFAGNIRVYYRVIYN